MKYNQKFTKKLFAKVEETDRLAAEIKNNLAGLGFDV